MCVRQRERQLPPAHRTSADASSPARSFCRKLVASTVMSYLAWLCLVPSVYINVADNEDGPW
jgi:hypothetical protein